MIDLIFMIFFIPFKNQKEYTLHIDSTYTASTVKNIEHLLQTKLNIQLLIFKNVLDILTTNYLIPINESYEQSIIPPF